MERLGTPARFGTGIQQQDLCCQLVIAPGCPVPVQAPASELFLGPQGCCSCSVSQFQRQLNPSLRRGWRLGSGPGLLPLLSHFLEGFFSFGLSRFLSQFPQVAVPTSDIQDRVKHRPHSCTTFELFFMGCVTSLLKRNLKLGVM